VESTSSCDSGPNGMLARKGHDLGQGQACLSKSACRPKILRSERRLLSMEAITRDGTSGETSQHGRSARRSRIALLHVSFRGAGLAFIE